MKMADVEYFYVSHFGWCNLKSFQEDWLPEMAPAPILSSCLV